MGSSVSPVVANIYMEMFEELALTTAPHAPRIWKRYVDDTFCIMEAEHVDHFLNHLNDLRPTIKFTMEQEKDGNLPFLDTLLSRTKKRKLEHQCIQKDHTYRQISSVLLTPSTTCKKRDGLLLIPPCQDHSYRRKHKTGRTSPENGSENQRLPRPRNPTCG